ncbi:MAG TPA: TetR/AcrR family transcriptional regulator [Mycobacteriales bacterium]|jgi:AcrR family transcriptional regulator|nr:TetR/AcrR family transcriptional regulator [Mycobacteriales bacterium]
MARAAAARRRPLEGDDTKSARTRERILDAAAYVLSRKGYSGTRLTDVAAKAEIQAPAIYYYFESRDDLIEAVMSVGLEHMREHVQAQLDALPKDTDAITRIKAAAEAHLRYELGISDYTTAAIRNAGQVPDAIRKHQLDEEAKYGEIWRLLIRDAEREGLLRPELDPFSARMLLLGALNWTAEWWRPHRDALDTVLRSAQAIVEHSLCDDATLKTLARRHGRTAQ